MKVIDLLNKIANGEETPKKIKYEEEIWELNPLNTTYDNGKCCLFEDYIDKKYVITDVLNDEVEIIEEDKKIEKIKSLNNVGNCETHAEFRDKQQLNNHILKDKINEIIDKLNEGDK